MKIRFEVAQSRSFFWPHFIRRAKKCGTILEEDGLHIIEVDGLDAALGLWQLARSWKAVWYYVDGREVGQARFNEVMRRHQFRDLSVGDMLRGVIEESEKRRQFHEGDARWRMGLGPDQEP